MTVGKSMINGKKDVSSEKSSTKFRIPIDTVEWQFHIASMILSINCRNKHIT